MKKHNNKYLSFIYKLFSKDITNNELKEFENWLEQDIEHRKLYEREKKLYELTAGFDRQLFSIDVSQEWDRFRRSKKNENVISFYSYFKPAMAIVAVLILFFGFSFLLPSRRVYIAERQLKELILPDKSVVKLYKNSKLVLGPAFNKRFRRVKLLGEAYFIISRNDKKPFIISANVFSVEVVGTEFYISQEKKQVIVNKGLVRVVLKDKHVLVKAGQGVVVAENSIINMTFDKNQFAWATGEFYFNNSTLAEVFSILEQNFDVKFVIKNKEIEKLRLTAQFKGQDLQTIIKIIAKSENINISKFEDKVYIVK